MRTQENIRLKISEKELLTNLAKREGITKSEYIRNLIKNEQRVYSLSPDEFDLLKKEFAKLSLLGSNINQISFHLNNEAKKDELELKSHVSELQKTCAEIRKELQATQSQIVKLIELKK